MATVRCLHAVAVDVPKAEGPERLKSPHPLPLLTPPVSLPQWQATCAASLAQCSLGGRAMTGWRGWAAGRAPALIAACFSVGQSCGTSPGQHRTMGLAYDVYS